MRLWDYVLAEAGGEALDLVKAVSDQPFNRVHEKHPAMLWPGRSAERVD